MSDPVDPKVYKAILDNSGPAFPSAGADVARVGGGGILPHSSMTLRDWFAGMALAEVPDPINESDAPATARLAYAIADAMLKERCGDRR